MTLTRKDKIERIALLEEKWRRKAKTNLFDFTQYTMPAFHPGWFHKTYYDQLSRFANREIKKLMVFAPPQHGKSEGSTRRLPAYLLGRDPERRVAVVSYSADIARKFNREVQRIIDSPEYSSLFPDTRITRIKEEDGMLGKFARTMAEVEVIGHQGSLKTVGVGGPLTGTPVDTLILDDIYKDAKTAWSPTHRETIQDWFDTVAESRLHNDSQVLIVFTRWHEHDLAGHLLEKEPDEWEVIRFPAIKDTPPDDIDPREIGEALWPEKHSAAKLQKTKERNPHVFQSLYQGNPRPKEGLLYKSFKTYSQLPSGVGLIKNVTDTADTGEDFLCSITYMPIQTGYYVIDVYYTQDGMETTEPGVAQTLKVNGVHDCKVESNNGGRAFVRNVERISRTIGNLKTSFRWYHQKDNKEVRIFSRASEVQNMVYMPEGWEHRWPKFHRDVTNYMSVGKNEHDDGPDCLTMIIEEESGAYKF